MQWLGHLCQQLKRQEPPKQVKQQFAEDGSSAPDAAAGAHELSPAIQMALTALLSHPLPTIKVRDLRGHVWQPCVFKACHHSHYVRDSVTMKLQRSAGALSCCLSFVACFCQKKTSGQHGLLKLSVWISGSTALLEPFPHCKCIYTGVSGLDCSSATELILAPSRKVLSKTGVGPDAQNDRPSTP